MLAAFTRRDFGHMDLVITIDDPKTDTKAVDADTAFPTPQYKLAKPRRIGNASAPRVARF
jgi:hypothetical protein